MCLRNQQHWLLAIKVDGSLAQHCHQKFSPICCFCVSLPASLLQKVIWIAICHIHCLPAEKDATNDLNKLSIDPFLKAEHQQLLKTWLLEVAANYV